MLQLILVSLMTLLYGPPAGLTISDDIVKLVIDRHTTDEQIQQYASRLWAEKHIQLNTVALERNKRGKIRFMHIEVATSQDEHGSASFKLGGCRKIGFYKNYAPGAPVSFMIGGMK